MTTGENAANFAELAEFRVHLSAHALNPAEEKLIIAGVVHQRFNKTEASLRLQGKLLTGMARQFWRDGGN